MCVSTLDLEHPEEKCSLVRVDSGLGASRREMQSSSGLDFFPHPTFSRPKWHEVSQWHRSG